MNRAVTTVLVAAFVLAGCSSSPGDEVEDMLTVGVVDAAGVALVGASVTLDAPAGTATKLANEKGLAFFRDTGEGPCTVTASAANFVTKQVNLECGLLVITTVSLAGVITVLPTLDNATTTTVDGGSPGPTEALFTVRGALVSEATGAAIAGAWNATRDGDIFAGGAAADGEFSFKATAGALRIEASSPCRPHVAREVSLSSDLDLEFRFAYGGTTPPAAPAVTAHSGPGSMASLSWTAVDGAHHYEVLEGDKVYDVGGALAWGDHTPSAQYGVRAVNTCGTLGAAGTVAGSAGAPVSYPSLATPQPFSPTITKRTYPVLGPDGEAVGEQAWRIVEGTGNCCENYLSTTRQGWIMDFGSEAMVFSQDEGVSWKRIAPHTIQTCGEGAVVPGPGGDIYAMNWEFCLGSAVTDAIWTLTYVAADDQWVEGVGPVHVPFYDRPWMTSMPGPHVGPDGAFWPTRSYIFSNVHDSTHGIGHVVAGDGSTYVPDAADAAVALPTGSLPPTLRFDPDADWTQPQTESYARALDPGLGVVGTAMLSCSQVLDTATGRACSPRDLPVRSMQRDAAGRLHAVDFQGAEVHYRWSDDVGASWQEVTFDLPGEATGVLSWDLKAHHQLDRAILAVHASVAGGATDYAVLLEDIGATPHVGRIFKVGADPGTAGAGVAASSRFDFMTTGFLPDGRIVLSFTDGEFHPPAVAIQLP